MVEDRIGYKYAKSLFDVAEENGLLESVKSDMDLIYDLTEDNKDLKNFLHSPIISSEKKRQILKEVFLNRLKTSQSMDLVSILALKGREMYLKQTAFAFKELYDKKHNIVRGVISSASRLPKMILKEIIQKIESQNDTKLELREEIDPELIGGFVLKLGDSVYDGSVKHALRKLERQFVN